MLCLKHEHIKIMFYSASSTLTGAPLLTSRNGLRSPITLPNTFTGLAALGFPSLLIGVGPKKIQNALPTGQ